MNDAQLTERAARAYAEILRDRYPGTDWLPVERADLTDTPALPGQVDPGYTTFASRTPNAAARKALRRMARLVADGWPS